MTEIKVQQWTKIYALKIHSETSSMFELAKHLEGLQ